MSSMILRFRCMSQKNPMGTLIVLIMAKELSCYFTLKKEIKEPFQISK